MDRNTSQGGPNGTVSYQYDAAGRRTRLTWPDSFYVTYDYLVTGEMTHIRENGAGSGLGVLATYAYDDLGRRTTLTRGNGTVSTWSYDNASRLTSLALDLASTANDVTNSYSYSPAGQITSFTRNNDGYAWTGAANVNRSYTTNGLNQHTLSGAVSLGYDARGNLTSSGSDSYGYSSENLLNSGPSVTLGYDPLLRLASIVTSSATTKWQYDGVNLIAEYNGSGMLIQRYVHGPGTNEPINHYVVGASARYWLHADERGSIVRATNDSGASVASLRYDEYGLPQFSTTPRFAYTGQTWIAELGMYNYKARMYSPTLGRFMQADPIGYGDGMNSYAYVRNDPLNRVDPTGSCGWQLSHYRNTYAVHADGREDPVSSTAVYEFSGACPEPIVVNGFSLKKNRHSIGTIEAIPQNPDNPTDQPQGPANADEADKKPNDPRVKCLNFILYVVCWISGEKGPSIPPRPRNPPTSVTRSGGPPRPGDPNYFRWPDPPKVVQPPVPTAPEPAPPVPLRPVPPVP